MKNARLQIMFRLAFGSRLVLLPVIAAAILFVQGCAVWNFVDTRYQNVTGYFNSYYNASRLYNTAMDDLEAERLSQALQPAQNLDDIPRMEPMMPPGGRSDMPGGRSDASDGATTPDGMVVTRDGDAGDAGGGMMPMTPPSIKMPMSAPSNAVIGLDKVIEKGSRILVNYPKSRWVDDALLMIGVSYFYKMEFTKAETKFKELLAGFPNGSLYCEGLLWLGKTCYAAEKLQDAETYLMQAVERATAEDEPDIAAEAWYTLGEMALDGRRAKAAIDCFQNGVDVARDTDLRFRLYLMLARQEEQFGDKTAAAEAYADIIRMGPGTKLMFTAELNYARLARETKRFDEAANTLVDMLDNPGYMDFDGEIQLEIGHLYVAVGEFNSAKDQYTYVDTTFKSQPVAAEAYYALGRLYEQEGRNYDKAYENYDKSRSAYPGAEAAKKGGKRADQLAEYRRMRNRMFDVDTLLFFVLHPDSLASRDSTQAIADSVSRSAKEAFDAQADAQRQLERLARRRPHGRNTGKVTLASLEPPPGSQQAQPGATPFVSPTGHLPLYRKLKLREVSPDSLLQVLSGMRIEMGWTMFDKLGDVDSALFYYRLALDGTLPDSLRANAYYSLAGIGRQIGDTLMTREYEDRLIRELPASFYARGIMLARGMELPKDSTTIAREAYDRAARILEQGRYEEGIAAMQAMAASYPHSGQAARAKLAVAMTYEMPLNQGAKALELYRALVAEHPSSPFSQRGREILAAIDAAAIKAETNVAEEKRKAEEEAKRLEQQQREEEQKKEKPERRRLLVEDQREIDSIRAAQKKASDPTQDPDFPLNLPGERKPDSAAAPQGKPAGGQPQTPPAEQGQPQTPPAGQEQPQTPPAGQGQPQTEVPVTPLGGGPPETPPPGKGK